VAERIQLHRHQGGKGGKGLSLERGGGGGGGAALTTATTTRRGLICCGRGSYQSLGHSLIASTRESPGSQTWFRHEPRLVPVAEFITCDMGFLGYMTYAHGSVEGDTRCLDSVAQRDGYQSWGGKHGFTPGTKMRHGSTAAIEFASTRGRCGFAPDTDTRRGSAGGGKGWRGGGRRPHRLDQGETQLHTWHRHETRLDLAPTRDAARSAAERAAFRVSESA